MSKHIRVKVTVGTGEILEINVGKPALKVDEDTIVYVLRYVLFAAVKKPVLIDVGYGYIVP